MSRLLHTDVAPIPQRTYSTLRFDWMVIALTLFLTGGIYLDGWAHNHGQADSSFFTPWHAVLYSGFLSIVIVLLAIMLPKTARGSTWLETLPIGYETLPIGTAIFSFAGASDLAWHTLFGIESDIEALLSPPHLGLAVGMALIVSAPLRAAWLRPDAPRGWRGWIPILLSLAFS